MNYRLVRRALPKSLAFLLSALSIALLLTLLAGPRAAHAEWHPISPAFPPHTNSIKYLISPDSQSVAYHADIEVDGVFHVYTIPISQTTPIRVTPDFVAGGSVIRLRYEYTPDSKSIVYIAEQEVKGRAELYVVPVEGGASQKLNGPLVSGGNVQSFLIDGDSGRVVYSADQTTDEVRELYSVPIGGGPSVKLNQNFVAGGDIFTYVIDPLSDRVVYTADAEVDVKNELYSVPIGGGASVKLNPPIIRHSSLDIGLGSSFAVSPIAPTVVFIAREAGKPGGNLFAVPTSGGTPTNLTPSLPSTQRLLDLEMSPTGDKVAYTMDEDNLNAVGRFGKLFTVLIAGGGITEVSTTPEKNFGATNFQFLPDGSRIVFAFQKDETSEPALISASSLVDSIALDAPPPAANTLTLFYLSMDSQYVAYLLQESTILQDISILPAGGGNATLHAMGMWGMFMPDSQRFLYTSGIGARDLYSALVTGGGERNLSALRCTDSARGPIASPDGNWIVYLANVDGKNQLRVSDGEEVQSDAKCSVLLPMIEGE